jgi:hypothetical protein
MAPVSNVRTDGPKCLPRVFVIWSLLALIGAAVAVALVGPYLWRRTSNDDRFLRGWVGGQGLLSPDGRFWGTMPLTWLDTVNPENQHWMCGSNKASLTIVPGNRTPEWKPYRCGARTKYAFEPSEELQMSACDLPIAMWRTNDELLVELLIDVNNDLQLSLPDHFPKKMTVSDRDGRPVHPKIVRPKQPCDE